jgi:hypothetical protein
MSRVGHTLLIPAALLALALPTAAQASASSVISDCARDGDLDQHYSNAELRQARKNLPADLDEYSDCREVISSAITSGPGRGGGGGQTHHAAKRRRKTAHRAAHKSFHEAGGQKPPRIGGMTLQPGGNGLFNLASAVQSLPLPLLVALLAAGLLAAAGGAVALRRRMPALSNLSLRGVKLPRFSR